MGWRHKPKLRALVNENIKGLAWDYGGLLDNGFQHPPEDFN